MHTQRGAIRCHCLDLSVGGMSVLSPQSARPKQRARIESSFEGVVLYLDAVVVRRKRSRQGYVLGLRFIDLDEPTLAPLTDPT